MPPHLRTAGQLDYWRCLDFMSDACLVRERLSLGLVGLEHH